MVRISVSPAAFGAIVSTMPLGSVGFERDPDNKGDRLIWIETRITDQIALIRRPGETLSDVILRLDAERQD